MSSHSTWAREIQGRLGVGYNSEFATSYASSGGIPGVSLKYGVSRHVAFEFILGVATTSPFNSVTAVKAFRNVFLEPNLNFYYMGGLGIISASGGSGVEVMGGIGAEFFFPGIESLGFAFETGASFDNGSGKYAVKTLGFSFLNAGIHFYF